MQVFEVVAMSWDGDEIPALRRNASANDACIETLSSNARTLHAKSSIDTVWSVLGEPLVLC